MALLFLLWAAATALDLLFPMNVMADQMVAPWVIPAALAGGGFLLDWLQNRRPTPAPLAPGTYTRVTPGMGGGGGGGGSSSSSTSTTNYSKSAQPFILPEYTGLMATLRKQMEQRLAQGPLPKGYEEGGLRAISDTYRGGEQAVQNQLIGRGLLGSPAEATAFAQQFTLPRLGEMSGFRAQIPLQARQFQNEDWGMLQQLLDAFGKGMKESGTSTTNSTSTSQSSGGGGGGGGPLPQSQQQRTPNMLLQMLPFLVQFLAARGSSSNSGKS